MKKFNVKLKGVSPFLMAKHPTPDEQANILKRESPSGKSKIKVKDLTNDEAFEMHSYKTEDGKFYLPSEMIESAMTKAATSFKMEGKKTFKDAFKGGTIVDPDKIIFKQQNFKSYGKWGVNHNTRGAVWVVRPRIDEWEVEFSLTLLQDERVSDEILRQILEYAGLYVGVGAWRPKFGRFEITKFELYD